jgi:hypothetical protein
VLPRLAGTIEIRQPVLTEQPEPPSSLRLTLVLINLAAADQLLPRLELYDENAELAAARRFGPEHYLPEANRRDELAPGVPVRPLLDLAPPPIPVAGFRVKLF